MAIPTWNAGEVLTASDVNTWFVPESVVKGSDTGRASTTTLTADPDLTLTLAVNATYYVQGVIFYDGGTGGSEGDLKWSFAVPSGSSGQYFASHQNLSGAFAGAFQNNWTDTATANTTGVGAIMVINLNGILATSSTTGSLTFNWAQNTSVGTNTHIKAQSFLVAQRIG